MGTTLMEDPPRKPQSNKTTLVESPRGGTRLAAPVGKPAEGAASNEKGEAESPVVGWLVVVDGPGRGRSLEIGFGMNIVGRDSGNRIALGFGDDQISGDDHFRIAYDGANRQFHLVPGRGTNLVYLGGSPLLAPVALSAHDELKVGATTLHFVPLCGENWDWS